MDSDRESCDVPFIRCARLTDRALLPTRAHPTDAGADLYSVEDVTVAPGQRVLVKTGLAVEIPPGYVGLVHPRSGLAVRKGITVVNAPGTIDSDYRGELCVALINLDQKESVTLPAGSRIAQLLIQKIELCTFVEEQALTTTERGIGGFGSTGV